MDGWRRRSLLGGADGGEWGVQKAARPATANQTQPKPIKINQPKSKQPPTQPHSHHPQSPPTTLNPLPRSQSPPHLLIQLVGRRRVPLELQHVAVAHGDGAQQRAAVLGQEDVCFFDFESNLNERDDDEMTGRRRTLHLPAFPPAKPSSSHQASRPVSSAHPARTSAPAGRGPAPPRSARARAPRARRAAVMGLIG